MATIDTVKEVLVENLDLEEKCDVEFGEPEGIETVGQLVAHIDSL